MDLREKSHPFIYSVKPNLTAQTWSRSTICHLLRRVKISPSLINTLGFQKEERPELHRGTSVHEWHRQLWQRRNGDPGEAGQGQRRASYSSLFSGLLCFKRGYHFLGDIGLALKSAGINLACVKQEPLETEAMQTYSEDLPPEGTCTLGFANQRFVCYWWASAGWQEQEGAKMLMEQTVWIVVYGKTQLGFGTCGCLQSCCLCGPPWWACGGGYGKTLTAQPPQSLQRAFGCISIIDNINYAHCYTLPWERLSIQANVFKSVRCSQSRRILAPLNGREQRYSLESCRLGEIASEAEELLLFTQSSPWLGQHFLSEVIQRWEKSSTYPILITAITIKCFCSWRNTRMAQSFLSGKRWCLNVHWASALYCCLLFPWLFPEGWSWCSFLIQQSHSPKVSWWGYAPHIWGHWRQMDCPA